MLHTNLTPTTPPQDQVGGLEQFRLLHQSFGLLKPPTQALLLTAYLKLLLADPGNAALQAEVVGVLGRQAKQLDPELQQRSAEYLVRPPVCAGNALCMHA